MIYGLASIVLGVAVLAVTCWAVERLDRRAPGERRVAWRPWYRTAIACGYYALLGCVAGWRGTTGVWLFFELLWLGGFPVLLVLQLATSSPVRLQILECFALCLSIVCGVLVAESLGLDTRRFLGESCWEAAWIFALWFATLSLIAAGSTLTVRGLRRLLRLPGP